MIRARAHCLLGSAHFNCSLCSAHDETTLWGDCSVAQCKGFRLLVDPGDICPPQNTTFINSSGHFPFGRSKFDFIIPVMMIPLAHSTNPLDSGCLRYKMYLCTNLVTTSFECFNIKLSSIVNRDSLWHTKPTNDVLPEELLDCGQSERS
jgi:hypothetical protein